MKEGPHQDGHQPPSRPKKQKKLLTLLKGPFSIPGYKSINDIYAIVHITAGKYQNFCDVII
jgi:hypothetical protein